MAELAMLGRIESVPEPLFIKRFHKDTSYYLTTRERAAWIDPESSHQVPQIQVLKGYLRAMSLVPLTPSQQRPVPGQRGPQDRQSPDAAPAAAAGAGQLSGHRGAPRRCQAHAADEAGLTPGDIGARPDERCSGSRFGCGSVRHRFRGGPSASWRGGNGSVRALKIPLSGNATAAGPPRDASMTAGTGSAIGARCRDRARAAPPGRRCRQRRTASSTPAAWPGAGSACGPNWR